ncbi:glycosyltransferase family 4 protein [Christensenella tenuis]|uniref:Glycosyltransferase family 4 protein n=1 Tax=Christensenella tenuis TaxID=2763033 RepID=A0ABR7EEI2_9FIRM|nr:glycosyltransferase family 4 protein [Christensenella tenuis]
MNTSAIAYIASQNNKVDLTEIRKRYGESDLFVCLAGDQEGLEEEGILSLTQLAGPKYKEYAFCLTGEELACFLSLKAAGFLLDSYETVAVVSDSGLFPDFPASCDTFHVFPNLLDEAEKSGSVDISLSSKPLFCNHSFALKQGKRITEFLTWSQKKYNRILFSGIGERGFLKAWLSYASLFGCRVHLMEKASFFEVPEYTEYCCFENGIPVADILRKYYGMDYRLRSKCKNQPFEHPDYFMRDTVVVGDSQTIPVTAIEKAIYLARGDLRALFPDLNDPEARIRFTEWFLQYARKEYKLAEEYLAAVQAAYQACLKLREAAQQRDRSLRKRFSIRRGAQTMPEAQYPFGVNLCGFIKGDFGLGESSRILARILQHANIPYTVIEVQDSGLHTFTNTEFADKISNKFIYDTNIFAYNPDCFEESVREFDKSVFEGRRNIGYWAWEMPEFPAEWAGAFPYFDEIWTCSDFTTQAIGQNSPIPVHTVPYAIHPQKDDNLTRQDFGLPEDQFIFLMTYDTRSISERKNPLAAIRAFSKAFGNRQDAMLLLKLNTPLDWDGDRDLMTLLKKHENIMTISRQMSKREINSLISLCDAYLSLHRSEGFGLGPAEAMAFAKPVVITNYSGNTQYMREGACCPVPYRLVEVKEDFIIYKKGMHWAEPDVDAAAEYMKRLVEDRDYYMSIGENAKRVIEQEFSYENCGKILLERLAHLK